MKSIRLTGEYKKKHDELLRRYVQEVNEKVPKPRATFDQKPDLVWKEIDKKYILMLDELTREGVAAGEFEEIETNWHNSLEQDY